MTPPEGSDCSTLESTGRSYMQAFAPNAVNVTGDQAAPYSFKQFGCEHVPASSCNMVTEDHNLNDGMRCRETHEMCSTYDECMSVGDCWAEFRDNWDLVDILMRQEGGVNGPSPLISSLPQLVHSTVRSTVNAR